MSKKPDHRGQQAGPDFDFISVEHFSGRYFMESDVMVPHPCKLSFFLTGNGVCGFINFYQLNGVAAKGNKF
jgi:hypothetical protein